MASEGIDMDRVRRVLIERTRNPSVLSMRKLSRGAGLSDGAVGDIIRGKSGVPTIPTLYALAEALGEDLSVFGIESAPVVTTEEQLRELIEEALPEMPARGWRRQAEYLAEYVADALGLPRNRPATETNGAR